MDQNQILTDTPIATVRKPFRKRRCVTCGASFHSQLDVAQCQDCQAREAIEGTAQKTKTKSKSKDASSTSGTK